PLAPFLYSPDVSSWRNILIAKGWSLSGDNIGECSLLRVSESNPSFTAAIYPNPAHDLIYIKNVPAVKSYVIVDASGRVIAKDSLTKDIINIQALAPGNYILQIISKDKIQSLKFIKH
ncbi:T9SS type A sorting domain-containing protein, partial [Bacillus sp. SIMBA_033]